MADISLSKSVRSNLISLKSTADMMANTQNRLSTGNKVNSALDNPSNWFTAKGLTSRAGDLNSLMDSMANGIQTLKAADNGLTSMTKTLESMQSTLRQARQDKSFQTSSFGIDATTLKDKTAVQTMSFKGGAVGDAPKSVEVTNTRAVTTATTAFANLALDSNATAGAFTAAAAVTFTIAPNAETATSVSMVATSETNIRVTIGSNSYDTEVTSAAATTKTDVAAALNKAFTGEKTGITVDGSAANLKFTVNADKAVADKDAKITFGADNTSLGIVAATDTKAKLTVAKSVDQIVDDINTKTGLTGFIRASNDNGSLRIENQSTQKLEVTGVTGGKVDGLTAKSDIAGNSVRAGLATQFNELRDQLDKLADDASFNGINLLRGDKLSITFNETGTSAINIQTKEGKTINSSNLKVATTLAEKDMDSDANIDLQLGKLKTAMNEVRAQASSFGSNLSIVQNRQDFTKSMIDTLEEGAGNLTLADMNQEAANLLALQTRQSLSQNSLSLASQADQSVLQLIR